MKLDITLKTHRWLAEHLDYDGPGCLTWPFSTARGYGNLGAGPGKKMMYAHRLMCELVNGPPPTDKHQAAHLCHNGQNACVHPEHIVWKTPSQNQLDKRETGRLNRSGRTKKITEFDVVAIRLLNGRATHDELAALFRVTRRNIGAIVHRQSWKNVA